MSIELNDQQRAAVETAASKQATAIKGAAGSGKTLVAVAIAQKLSEAQDLFTNPEDKHVTIVTYTNSLVSYVKNQIPETSSVKTCTVHSYLRKVLNANGIEFKYKTPKQFLKRRLDFAKFTLDFTIEEFAYILGKGLKSRDDYLKAKRTGRKQALRAGDRNYLFDLLEEYLEELSSSERIDYNDVGNRVLELCSDSSFERISTDLVIDEVQDLPATVIQALSRTVDGKVVYIGDVAQSIYGSGFTWKESVGKTLVPLELNTNYRNTRQIYETADSILKFEYEINEATAQESSQKNATALAEGKRPQVFFCSSEEDEAYNAQLKISQLLKSADENESIAIGFRGRSGQLSRITDHIKAKLRSKGITYYDKKDDENNGANPFAARVVFSTLHSMKGLEFDHVLLIDLEDNVFFKDQERKEETERRLLFVAMTRARKTLSLFSGSDEPLRFLGEISSSKVLPIAWNQTSYEKTYLTQISRVDESRTALREQHAKQNAQIALLEEEIDRLKKSSETSEQSLTSLLSEKDERILALDSELRRASEHQAELEAKLQYFASERGKAVSRFDADEQALGVAEYCFRDDAKILILGGGGGIKDKEIQGILKSLGLPSNAYRCIPYDEVTNFDITNCEHSIDYSDIFIGTSPHKAKGIGSASSLLQFLRDNSDSYPKLAVFENQDGTLAKITKTKFRENVKNSDLYAAAHGL